MPGINTNPKIVVETTEEFEELIERMSGKSTSTKPKQVIDTKGEPMIESKEDSNG